MIVIREINKLLGFALVMLISTSAISQTASVIFESKNQFQVTINNSQQHNDFSNSLIINKITGDKPYNLKVEFKNDTIILQKNIYLIDQGLAHIFQLSKESIQLKKVVPALSLKKAESQLSIDFVENTSFAIDTLKKDTINAKDTAYVVPFASYYELKDYDGRIGCPFPLKEEDKNELRGLIISQKLEESKFEIIREKILDMDSACVLIDQIKELSSLFEYEETRLEFINFIAPFTFDLDNYERLYPLFDFDNSKDEIKELFKK